ncbi:hypothetical protein D9M68_630150 [compost metagenome]
MVKTQSLPTTPANSSSAEAKASGDTFGGVLMTSHDDPGNQGIGLIRGYVVLLQYDCAV